MSKGLFDRLQRELDAKEKSAGLSMADMLELPESLRALVNWMMRRDNASLAEVAAFLEQDEVAAGETLATLIDKGFVRELKLHGEACYRLRLAPKRGRTVPLDVWRALDDKIEE